jgi:hypothetical protein
MKGKKGVDISESKVNIKVSKKAKPKSKKILYWIAAIIIFYVLTSAKPGLETIEVEKQLENATPVVVEKLVKVTKYREERVPFGPTRCQQFVYNFSREYSYTEEFPDGQKIGICTFAVKNEEDIAGTFKLFANILKNGKISDSPDITKDIGPFETAAFQWNFTLEPTQTASCLLQCSDCPHRVKCFYLEPTTYQIKQIPYTAEEARNVTEYKTGTVKQNITATVYRNRFFGYMQFFYFGY